MVKITVIVHTRNDERRIGRTLETLRPCDELLVVDHGSSDRTCEVARQYGAVILKAGEDSPSKAARHGWLLCLLPSESLSEALEGEIFEWKLAEPAPALAFAVKIREETRDGTRLLPPETRLVRRDTVQWAGALPAPVEGAQLLGGELWRFSNPDE